MIVDEFVTDEDWHDAPEDERAAFLFVADRARAKLKLIYDSVVDDNDIDFVEGRFSFVHDISAIADGLGISGLPSPTTSNVNEEFYRKFDSHLRTILARIRTENRGRALPNTIPLSHVTKENLRQHLESLRDKINKSNLSEKQKESLHKRVNAVDLELDKKETSLTTLWLLTGALHFAGAVSDVGGFTTVVQDINELVQTEGKKEVEREAAQQPPRITHQPVKQLEDRTGRIDQDDRQA